MKTGFFKQHGSLIFFLLWLVGAVLLVPRADEITQHLIEFTTEHFKSEIIEKQISEHQLHEAQPNKPAAATDDKN